MVKDRVMKTVKNFKEANDLFCSESRKTFIQWKGTDLCMDFYCECGEHNHYDGYFAYTIICSSCNQVYALEPSVNIIKLSENDNSALKPIDY